MMSPRVLLVEDQITRLGFLAKPSTMRALIPESVVGTYLLLNGSQPVYVGRSDTCLRTRLSKHPLLDVASHVVWEPFQTPRQAYLTECAWYHELIDRGVAINQIHPAVPAYSLYVCPFCVDGDDTALDYCMSRREVFRHGFRCDVSLDDENKAGTSKQYEVPLLECVGRPKAVDAKRQRK
jgi:hypothetical protein